MLRIGKIKTLVRQGTTVRVYFDDNTSINAIAATDLNAATVAVFIEDSTKQAYAYLQGNTTAINSRTNEFTKKRPDVPIAPEKPEDVKPIKILFTKENLDTNKTEFYIGGDRETPILVNEIELNLSFRVRFFATGRGLNDWSLSFFWQTYQNNIREESYRHIHIKTVRPYSSSEIVLNHPVVNNDNGLSEFMPYNNTYKIENAISFNIHNEVNYILEQGLFEDYFLITRYTNNAVHTFYKGHSRVGFDEYQYLPNMYHESVKTEYIGFLNGFSNINDLKVHTITIKDRDYRQIQPLPYSLNVSGINVHYDNNSEKNTNNILQIGQFNKPQIETSNSASSGDEQYSYSGQDWKIGTFNSVQERENINVGNNFRTSFDNRSFIGSEYKETSYNDGDIYYARERSGKLTDRDIRNEKRTYNFNIFCETIGKPKKFISSDIFSKDTTTSKLSSEDFTVVENTPTIQERLYNHFYNRDDPNNITLKDEVSEFVFSENELYFTDHHSFFNTKIYCLKKGYHIHDWSSLNSIVVRSFDLYGDDSNFYEDLGEIEYYPIDNVKAIIYAYYIPE